MYIAPLDSVSFLLYSIAPAKCQRLQEIRKEKANKKATLMQGACL